VFQIVMPVCTDIAAATSCHQLPKEELSDAVENYPELELEMMRQQNWELTCVDVIATKLLSVDPLIRKMFDDDEPLPKRRKSVKIPAVPQRTSAAKHLPEMTDVTNSMRCRLDGCSGKSKVRCIACKVFLCMTSDRNCFRNFTRCNAV